MSLPYSKIQDAMYFSCVSAVLQLGPKHTPSQCVRLSFRATSINYVGPQSP